MEEIMESISNEKMQFAVLIDADNISSKYAVTIFEELEKYGLTSYRRIYGNWSKGNGWSEVLLLEHSIMLRIWRWLLMPWIFYTKIKYRDSVW